MIFWKVYEMVEENLNVISWDQNKKYRLEQDDINVIAGMIDSKIPINVIDFEGNKKGEKKQNFIKKFPFEANNPSEFSKREEVIKYI